MLFPQDLQTGAREPYSIDRRGRSTLLLHILSSSSSRVLNWFVCLIADMRVLSLLSDRDLCPVTVGGARGTFDLT